MPITAEYKFYWGVVSYFPMLYKLGTDPNSSLSQMEEILKKLTLSGKQFSESCFDSLAYGIHILTGESVNHMQLLDCKNMHEVFLLCKDDIK